MAKEQRKSCNVKEKVKAFLTGTTSPLKKGVWVNKEELNKLVNKKVQAPHWAIDNVIRDLTEENKVQMKRDNNKRYWSL